MHALTIMILGLQRHCSNRRDIKHEQPWEFLEITSFRVVPNETEYSTTGVPKNLTQTPIDRRGVGVLVPVVDSLSSRSPSFKLVIFATLLEAPEYFNSTWCSDSAKQVIFLPHPARSTSTSTAVPLLSL